MSNQENHTGNVRRLAKNTALLYMRMFVSMLISLYTSRVILSALGVEDYGIYNVVGGFVSLFGIITSTLNIAINRFLTFELGSGNTDKLNRVFSTSVTIQVLISLFLIIIAETLGLWYVNNVMVIPDERLLAANWCYQFAIASCVIGLIIVPYNSVIIAHEDMSIYAYMGIFSSLFALLIAFLIKYSSTDRLILYGFLLLISASINFIVFLCFCKRNYNEAKFKIYFDKETFSSMFGFASWNFIGAGAYIMVMQGGNLLINLFFGPFVNASRGISNTVNTAIKNFGSNFTIALKPQITKAYASGEYTYLFNLVFRGAKLSVFLMLFISAPVLLNTEFVLRVWLTEVPPYAVLFTKLAIIYTLIEMLDGPLMTTLLATGKIKYYEITEGVLQVLNLITAWYLLSKGGSPEIVLIICVITIHLTLCAKLLFLRKYLKMQIREFIIKVYGRVLVAVIVGFIIPVFLYLIIQKGWCNFIITSLVTLVSMALSMFYVGSDSSEREYVIGIFRNVISKTFKKYQI